MTWFWFLCFSGMMLFHFTRVKKLGFAKILHQKTEALRDETAKDRYEANNLKAEAELIVGKMKEENTVYHEAVEEIVNLWINDSWKSISDKLTADNFGTQKNRMEKVFETCRKYGIDFNSRQEKSFYAKLEGAWKEECAAEKAKAEQARIREIMKEEQRAEKMKASELKKIEQERKLLEEKKDEQESRLKLLQELEALKQLTEEQKDELASAIDDKAALQKQIEENARKQSMAELTKAGHIYVISNYGSFGETIYKVGMTRRLIPEDRVKELGDASVPFPFDIHLMIATENAPALEYKLHEELWDHRLNLVNDGKEFFKTNLLDIKKMVDKHGGGIVYEFKEHAHAQQWRESEIRRKQGEFGQFKESVYATVEEEVAT